MAFSMYIVLTGMGCAEYAQVLRMLGNGRLEAFFIDGVKRLCHIRGKMRKKVWVNTVRSDVVWPAAQSAQLAGLFASLL